MLPIPMPCAAETPPTVFAVHGAVPAPWPRHAQSFPACSETGDGRSWVGLHPRRRILNPNLDQFYPQVNPNKIVESSSNSRWSRLEESSIHTPKVFPYINPDRRPFPWPQNRAVVPLQAAAIAESFQASSHRTNCRRSSSGWWCCRTKKGLSQTTHAVSWRRRWSLKPRPHHRAPRAEHTHRRGPL
jgi:hypothetical protein